MGCVSSQTQDGAAMLEASGRIEQFYADGADTKKVRKPAARLDPSPVLIEALA